MPALIENFWETVLSRVTRDPGIPHGSDFYYCLPADPNVKALCLRIIGDYPHIITAYEGPTVHVVIEPPNYTMRQQASQVLGLHAYIGANYSACPSGNGLPPYEERSLEQFRTQPYAEVNYDDQREFFGYGDTHHDGWHGQSEFDRELDHIHLRKGGGQPISSENLRHMLGCLGKYRDEQGNLIVTEEQIKRIMENFERTRLQTQVKKFAEETIQQFFYYFLTALLLELANYFTGPKSHPHLRKYNDAIIAIKFLIKLFVEYQAFSLLNPGWKVGVAMLTGVLPRLGFSAQLLDGSFFAPLRMMIYLFNLLASGEYVAIVRTLATPYAALFSGKAAAYLAHRIAVTMLASIAKKYD